MIFGHLKAQDFINKIEGAELRGNLETHLRFCGKCSDALVSAKSLYLDMTQAAAYEREADDTPEPDWLQFRGDVRNAMLSRAAQRQSKANHWSGLFLKPAMSWSLAIVFAAGLFIWNQQGSRTPAPVQTASITTTAPRGSASVATSPALPAASRSTLTPAATTEEVRSASRSIRSEIAAWSGTSAFEGAVQLDDAQSARFQELLAGALREVPPSQ